MDSWSASRWPTLYMYCARDWGGDYDHMSFEQQCQRKLCIFLPRNIWARTTVVSLQLEVRWSRWGLLHVRLSTNRLRGRFLSPHRVVFPLGRGCHATREHCRHAYTTPHRASLHCELKIKMKWSFKWNLIFLGYNGKSQLALQIYSPCPLDRTKLDVTFTTLGGLVKFVSAVAYQTGETPWNHLVHTIFACLVCSCEIMSNVILILRWACWCVQRDKISKANECEWQLSELTRVGLRGINCAMYRSGPYVTWSLHYASVSDAL